MPGLNARTSILTQGQQTFHPHLLTEHQFARPRDRQYPPTSNRTPREASSSRSGVKLDRVCYVECMAREESSREDLLREATALVERIELIPKGSTSDGHIVAGFRRNGALSVFFGEDPVYQFNAAGELRRAYTDGKLLKAERGRLSAFERVRTQNEVQLVRHELNETDMIHFQAQMANHLQALAELINTNAFDVAGQVPPDADVLGRLKRWFGAHNNVQIARRPNA